MDVDEIARSAAVNAFDDGERRWIFERFFDDTEPFCRECRHADVLISDKMAVDSGWCEGYEPKLSHDAQHVFDRSELLVTGVHAYRHKLVVTHDTEYVAIKCG